MPPFLLESRLKFVRESSINPRQNCCTAQKSAKWPEYSYGPKFVAAQSNQKSANQVAPIQIALAQVKLRVGDVSGNAAKVREYAAKAKNAGARLVVFPELTLTGYPPEDLLLRPAFCQQVQSALNDLAAEDLGIDVVVGYVQARGKQLYNAAAWLGDGNVLGEYHKQMLPNYSVFDEKRYFTPGTKALVVERFGVKFGVTICEDIWSARPAAAAKKSGAEVLLNINASPFHGDKTDERISVLEARVQETGLPLAYVNLVGGQDELVFDGDSMAMNPGGTVQHIGPSCEEALIPLKIVKAADKNDNRFEFAQPEVLYPLEQGQWAEEAEIYQALVRGVKDYIDDNGFPGIVLGLSGGIDSALTLAIAVDALGPEKVEAVMMPSRFTAGMSQNDAKEQADIMAVHYHEITIEPLFNAFTTALAPRFDGLEADTTEENIQARCRGVLLMAISNKSGRMVLTTGNKSEMAVGYATLYGDMAGGFAPLKDVFKLMVYRLSNYRNSLGRVIPERVITRPPSAELREDQQDSDSLPDYDELDAILEGLVEREASLAELVEEGFPAETVTRIAAMVKRNEYKRRQAPPGVRISKRAFGKDRRYPITSGYSEVLK